MSNEKQVPELKSKENQLLSQREAVYLAAVNVIKAKGLKVKSKQAVKGVITEENLQALYRDLARGFKAGKIALKPNANNQKKLEDQKALQVYIIGLVSNWFRRDPRLNGETDIGIQ